MDLHVDFEVSGLREVLAALGTLEWTDAGVQEHVAIQVAGDAETPAALQAGERLLAGVAAHVRDEIAVVTENLSALRTLGHFWCRVLVDPGMLFQVAGRREPPLADGALRRRQHRCFTFSFASARDHLRDVMFWRKVVETVIRDRMNSQVVKLQVVEGRQTCAANLAEVHVFAITCALHLQHVLHFSVVTNSDTAVYTYVVL